MAFKVYQFENGEIVSLPIDWVVNNTVSLCIIYENIGCIVMLKIYQQVRFEAKKVKDYINFNRKPYKKWKLYNVTEVGDKSFGKYGQR